MHEDKFEKQVSEKMDQLKFDPADAVWLRVDREINERKNRRKPIFWIFFLSGLLIAGGATYIGLNHFTPVKEIPVRKITAGKTNQKTPQNKHQTGSDSTYLKTNLGSLSGSFQSREKPQIKAGRALVTVKTTLKSDHYQFGEQHIEEQSGEKMQTQLQSGMVSKNSPGTENSKAGPVINENTNKKVVTADSVSDLNTVKDKLQKTKKSKWSIGFSTGAGVSNVNESLFQPQNPANLSASLYYPYLNSIGSPATVNIPNESSAGFSFNLGVFVKRNLSTRISASVGLGYHYYSTKIHTGVPVYSAYTVSYNNFMAAPVSSYYRNGNTQKFTNQYHFIELPVNLSLQVNKSHKNPVNWEAGLILAWMVSSNALHFDPYNNVYFENSQLFNKFQWNAATALMVGFPVHTHTIQVGPQVQYGLTSLLKNSGSSPGHLTYFGLKISFNP